MKKIMLALAMTAALSATSAQAELVATDWQTTGDALATLDTATGIEWLDLTLTDDLSINDVQALLSSTYAGWRLPTYEEVQQLFRNVLGTTLNKNSNKTIGSAEYYDFESHFGNTYSQVAYGSYLGNDGIVYVGGTGGGAPYAIYTDYSYGNSVGLGVQYAGVFLVSDGGVTLSSINDPSLNINNPNAPINTGVGGGGNPADVPVPAGLGVLAALGLLGWRRKQRQMK